MPIQVIWDNPEKTVIRQIFEGRWTLDDYHRALDEVKELCKNVPYRVHIIGDLTTSTSLPNDMFTVLNRIVRFMQYDWDMVVVTHANAHYKSILKVVEILAPMITYRIRYAHDVEEARQIICDQKKTVNNSATRKF